MKTDNATINCMKYTSFAVLICSLLILCLPAVGNAQVSGTHIVIDPEQPRGGEQFVAQVISPSVDLDRSTISWYLNDKLALSGTGKKGFTGQAGPVGTELRIKAVITTPTGAVITRNALVRAQEVDVLWRGYSYTPPFYPGKALPPSGGLVILTAMPNMVDGSGNHFDPSNLVYTWSERGVVLGKASGYGKQSIVLENGQVDKSPLQISVKVASYDGTVAAQNKGVEVPVEKPEIIFYEHLPLDGVRYEESLSELNVEKEETILRAEPYYFSLDDIAKDLLEYTWSLNGNTTETPDKKNEITLRANGGSGDAQLSLDIIDNNLPLRVLQEAKRNFMIHIQ